MTKIERTSVALFAVALLVVAVPVFAAQQAQEPTQEPAKVEGELLRVDVDSQTITIKTSADSEVEFRYTEETEVTGAREGVAGLATANGASVIVHYVQEDAQYKAVKIEVQSNE